MSPEPVFLTREVIDSIHANSLALFGGSAGIRDDALVESSLGSDQNTTASAAALMMAPCMTR